MELRNLQHDRAEAAGHLIAELYIVRDELSHGRMSAESARSRIAIIRERARSASESAINTSFTQLSMQWDEIMSQAEMLRTAMVFAAEQESSQVC